MFQELESSTTSTLPFAVAAFLALLLFALGTRKGNGKKKPWPSVPGALPVVGNSLQIKGTANLTNRMEEWADKYSKETGCFEVNLAGTRYVVVCSEERMKEVMLKRPNKVTRNPKACASAHSVGADGVAAAEGSKWQSDRRLVAPCFNHSQIRDYLPHVKTVMNRLIHKWKQDAKAHDGGETVPVAINDDLIAYTIDTTGLTALGLDFDTLRSSDSVDAKDLVTLSAGVHLRVLSPIPFWDIPFIGQYLDGLGWACQRVKDRMIQIIESKEKQRRNGEESSGSGNFIQKTIDQCNKDASFNRSRIIGNILTIIIASTDTTSSTLMTAVQKLAEDKSGLQQELLEEIDNALPRDLAEISLDDLLPDNLPKLNAFMFEVLRCYSPFSFLSLQAADSIPFCGTTLEKGTCIFALLRYCTMNPYTPAKGVPVGPNGEPSTEFCARRFLKHNDDGQVTAITMPRNSTSYLPFGFGSRECLGRAYSEASMTLTIAALIKTFEMKLAPDHAPIGRTKVLAEVPDIDVRVEFGEREY